MPTPKRLAERMSFYFAAMALVMAIACTVALTAVARQTLLDAHARAIEAHARALTVSISQHLTHGWSPAADRTLDAIELDPRTAFVEVADPEGALLAQRIVDVDAWLAFSLKRDEAPGVQGLGRPVTLPDRAAVALTAPLWDPPLRVAAPRPAPDVEARELEGYLSIGMRDPDLPATLDRLFWSELAIVGMACAVFLPLAVFALLRWLAPLRRLSVAVGEMAEGRWPERLPEQRHDELGLLARGFNAMVDRLFLAQGALEAANHDLESEVARRTAQLEAANQRLEAEARDKEDFLRAVTHDLHAPVRNISGLASMIAAKYADALADDALRKLDRINANARHQTELIQDLLELSRIRTRAGRREEFELGEVLDQLRDAFAFDLEKAGIELRIVGDMPRLYAERNRVRQLFQNLLDNAIKYMLDAKVRVITIGHAEDEHTHFFAVSDTGHGIAPSDLDRVFQMFRRSAHSGTDQIPGKGVGLASVKTIVEAYGGSIRASSALGKGARFDFTFAKSMLVARDDDPSGSLAGYVLDAPAS